MMILSHQLGLATGGRGAGAFVLSSCCRLLARFIPVSKTSIRFCPARSLAVALARYYGTITREGIGLLKVG